MKVTRKERLKNLRKWVKALRSGKYRQTTGTLVETHNGRKNAYCCLGVACKILDVPKVDYVGHGTLEDLPNVQNMLGIDSGGTLPSDATVDLTVLNDAEGYNFKQIANVIVKEFSNPLKKAIKNKKRVAVREEE
jgi:hypothetical protein